MKNRWLTTFSLMLIGVLTLSACGGVPTPAASSQINLSTQPNPPVKGPVQLIVDITDTQGRPLDNAMVLVLASHATMGNMIQQGPAAAQGTGRYVFTADLSGMNGQWLITVQVSKGTLNLAQDFKIDVP